MTETVIKEKTFVAPTKKVYIKPAPIARALFTDATNPEAFLFGNSRINYSLPRDRQGNLINPFTSKEEQKWLEKELDVDMNIYKRGPDNFWTKYKLTLDKNKRELDLSNPKDYLDYIVARTLDTFVAKNEDLKKRRKTQIFLLVEEEYENQVKVSKIDKLKEAYILLGKLEASGKEEMINFLRVAGKRPDKNSKIDFLKAQVNEVLEADIDTFIELAKDKNFSVKVLLEEAVHYNIVNKVKREYVLPGGDKLAFAGKTATIDNAVEYLTDPSNQDILLSIQARVKTAKD